MMLELNLDKDKVRRSFAAAAQNYDSVAQLQRQVGLSLVRRFPLRDPLHQVVLDVGCGTGFLSHQLAASLPGYLLALDIALPMLQTCRAHYQNMSAGYLCGDAEWMPIKDKSIDSIYSNLALQWAQDLSETLCGFKRILRPSGRLVFATFGPKTLQELKAAWAHVDAYKHVNEFHSATEIENYLTLAGFGGLRIENEVYVSRYDSVETLMRELKGLGAHNVNRERNPKPTTKTQLQHMIEHYQAQMPGEDILASYEIIFVQASKAS